MIRPFTCLCMIAAGGAGLYLYQTKYQAQLLDRDIKQAVDATQAARARTAVLRTDWAMLNEPDRLKALSARLLPNLKPTLPTQLVQLADLGAHLPPPIVPGAAAGGTDRDEDADMPVRAPAATPLAAQPPAAPARPIASASAPAVASLPRPHLAEELPRPPVPEKHPAPALMAHAAPTPVATPVAERRTPSLLAAVTPPRAPIPLAPPPVQPAIGQFSAQPASASPAHPAAMGQAASVQPAYTPHSYMPIGAPVVRTMAPMQGRPPVAPASDERWVAPQAGTSMVSSLGAQRTQMAPPVPIGAHP